MPDCGKLERNTGLHQVKKGEARMESPYNVEPQLNEKQLFWKNLQPKCLQRFISVRWKASESQWITQSCKFHLFTGILWKALTTIREEDLVEMKRKQGEE